jgi:LPXTG-motif cell wall-anchored protein
MGLRLLKMMLVALLALVLGYVAALGVGLVVFEVFEVSQREGANAMGLAFVICPFVAVISAVIAAIWYWISSGRRAATTSPTAVETRRGNAVRVFAIAVSVVVGWLAGTLLQWLLAGRSYETFVVALAVSLAPWIGMIILGGATWWLTRRRKALTS